MANVNIKFNGKEFLLSCEDGQEEHLEELSIHINQKFIDLKNNLGKGNLLIVTSNSFRKNKIVKVIEKSKNKIFIFSSVKPNPTIEEIDQLTETYKSKNIKTIIALGGGSVLDTAKTLSIIINNQNKKLLNDFFRKKKKFKFISKTKLIRCKKEFIKGKNQISEVIKP